MARNVAKINNEALKWARSNTPFTIAEIAKRLKKKKELIEAWESGLKYPTVNQAMELASLYKLPLASFFYKNIPEKQVEKYEDRRTLMSQTSKDSSPELWKAIQKMHSLRDVALIIDSRPRTNLPIINESESYSEVAKKIKSFFRMENVYDFRDVRICIENNGIIVSAVRGVSINEMRGVSIYYDELPMIGINNVDSKNAKLFTLFHELGHIVRHNSALCSVNVNINDDTEENACNSIAAEILMPADEILRNTELKNISEENVYLFSEQVNVSCFALLKRLYDLKMIGYRTYTRIYTYCDNKYKTYLKNNNAKRKNYAHIPYQYTYLNEYGYCFTNSVLSDYANGLISFGEACLTLNVSSKNFDKIYKEASNIK